VEFGRLGGESLQRGSFVLGMTNTGSAAGKTEEDDIVSSGNEGDEKKDSYWKKSRLEEY